MTKNGPRVLEYNVRGGDPETQTLLPLLSEDTDLAKIMVACSEHWLDGVTVKVEPQYAATVIAVAEGYPGSYAKGRDITLTGGAPETLIFHAGTTITDGQLKSSGGRVIAATATASTLEEAVKKSYTGISTIDFQGMHYRKDIAHRAFASSRPLVKKDDEPLTYASAGVSIDAGNDLVDQIKANVARTRRPGSDAVIGGFGGTFSLSSSNSGFHSSSPTLIGAIDGVGTKLKIAHEMRIHNTVGIDLVAMNVNDLVVQGAEPLMFLDCYSCGKLDVEVAASFVSGVADGCVEAGCALIGGETAEMPGLFIGDSYDAAGAAIGAIDTSTHRILPDFNSMRSGDVLLGIASSGPHSNGYSLIRKIVERSGLSFNSPTPYETKTPTPSLGAALLTPTRIYVKPLLASIRASAPGAIKGLAHITGGGLVENIPRALPKHLRAEVDVASWPLPGVFKWLKKTGQVRAEEMARAFNNGIGMIAVVSQDEAESVKKHLEGQGETVYTVGKLSERESPKGEGCVLRNLESWDE